MLIKRAPMFKASEITDYRLYLNRREFMLGAAALALDAAGGVGGGGTGRRGSR